MSIRLATVIEAGLVAALVLTSTRASAQSSVAEKLFIDGRTLMQQGKFPEACDKFRASYDLDRTATGTLLNLALCHEQIGKNASAWTEFRVVAAESALKRPDRVELARTHENKLKDLIEYVIFEVEPSVRVAGLSIVVDGNNPILAAAWDVPVPMDSGAHTVSVSATDKIVATQTFDVADKPLSVNRVKILPLVDAPKAPPTIASSDPSAPKRRIAGIVVGAAGLAAVGVGTFFGVRALGKTSDVKDMCGPDRICPTTSQTDTANEALSSAKASSTLSNVFLGGGALLVATGAVLYLTALPSAPRASISTDGRTASIALTGTF